MLAQRFPWPGSFCPEALKQDQDNLSVLSIYTALVTMGGMNPMSYGILSGGGPYGRQGLEQDEFFWMLRHSGWIQGYLTAKPEEASWFQTEIQKELLIRIPEIEIGV